MFPFESEGRKKLVLQFEDRQEEFMLTWGRITLFLFRPLMSWMWSIQVGEDNLLYSVYQFKC